MKKIFAIIIFLLSVFEIKAEIIYTEPVQNAKYVNVKNNIIVGFDDLIISSDLSNLIMVDGRKSGRHSGEIIMTSDGKSLLFIPDQPFYYSEIVNVNINEVLTGSASGNSLSYSFQTEKERSNIQTYNSFTNEFDNPAGNSVFNYIDGTGLENLEVTISNNPSPGQLFMSNFPFTAIPFTPYIFTVNNRGSILSSINVTSHLRVVDYKRQPNGLRTFFSYKNTKYYALNDLNQIVDSFACGNGYITDQHEIKILNNGHILLMSYDPQLIDMNVIVPGGNPNAEVVGLIIQELDKNRNVVFQWRSWDHVEITEAIHENLNATVVDYVHGNAIEPDHDGNILISSRHLSEISKISRSTGEFIWRLGGVHNEFTFPNDPAGFSYQHDIRRIANGNVTLYDNGNYHSPPSSRAAEYHLDEVNKVATLVWEYRKDPAIYGFAMGSVQRLKNGNTLISWGSANPTITEVTQDGDIALEMTLPDGIYTYRTFRDEINLTLNVKMAIEGFYNPVTDKLNMSDTVRAYIRDSNSPFSIIDSARSVIDSDNFNGNFRYYNVADGTYYISIRHRNGLETWSKSGGESFTSGGVYKYDFTGSASNSYGSNVTLKGSKYCFYSGDTDQDGNINLTDILLISNDCANYVTGYADTDVNGDNITDLTDLVIAFNNAKNFISKITP
ncbi:MAG TPA: aryl-sulfate sulfotransferase [Ignavibacteria bacterium]|nr:aryl-sulfate sulfotransferase [Ignavibacteria bacterium]HMR39880.1 aryl-sulfate sulfotransferase [Ignavibacteria bacterium]